MCKLNSKKVSKYFLYMLLCVCVFVVMIALACFIAGNTNVFEWEEASRASFVIIYVIICIAATATF